MSGLRSTPLLLRAAGSWPRERDRSVLWGRNPARRMSGPGGERGSVTVEAALVLPALIVVLVLCLAGIGGISAQLRCADAAASAARLAARGDTDGAHAAATLLAPDGATVEVSLEGDRVRVRVAVRPLGAILPSLQVQAVVVAIREPESAGGAGVDAGTWTG